MKQKFRIESGGIANIQKRKGDLIKKVIPKGLMQYLQMNRIDKIYWKLNHFKKYKTTDFFRNIDIEINTSCNRRCSYCPNSIYERGLIKNEKLMKEKTFKKIIDELAEIKFDGGISPASYGEPLLDKRIFDFLAYARQKLPKAQLTICTNGDYLTIEKYNKLINSGMNRIIISKHGEEDSSNIKEIFDYLEKNPEKKVKIVYKSFNSETTPLSNRGGYAKPNVINYDPPCVYSCNPVIIDYAGNVVLCCNDYFSSHIFGNVNDQKLADIWNSESYKKMRKELKKKHFYLPICKKCTGIEKS